MKNLFRISTLVLLFAIISAQSVNQITLHPDSAKYQISKNIYGHFSEHLGKCIYGGIWVGTDSPIPNTRGIRNDVVKALREIKIPNLRWPGGCYADQYHWMDGIGDPAKRQGTVNTNWGGVLEDNSFGTHEFMDLCGQVGCEPVICGNIGSGTVKEMADWVEYLTSDFETEMTELRKKNGREKPWKVKFWGIGNETWGCGGIMTPEYYSDLLKRYGRFLNNYSGNVLYKVAVGPSDNNYNWTEYLMKEWQKTDGWLKGYMDALSLHSYTICKNWSIKGSAVDFDESEWFSTFLKTLKMDEYINGHTAIMDKYDPENKIGLVVDEWGNWFDPAPGSNPAFLQQQNTLRDALVASVNLDIFNNHCRRVKMANLAQIVNVLQAVIFTSDNGIVLTPTYYVFKMYTVHHDATLIPLEIKCENFTMDGNSIPSISSSASIDSAGLTHITLTNINPEKAETVEIAIGKEKKEFTYGQIITAPEMNSLNDFGQPEQVYIKDFYDVKIDGSTLKVNLPAKSVVMIELK